jgi:hypothetical protein
MFVAQKMYAERYHVPVSVDDNRMAMIDLAAASSYSVLIYYVTSC